MRVYKWHEFLHNTDDFSRGSAVTIGSFDGPHLGHRALFDEVMLQNEYMKGVITFNEPPKAVHRPHEFSGLISTLQLRLEYFSSIGLSFAVVIDFSAEFGKMKGTDFLNAVTKSCFLKHMVIGSDFKCGHNLDTDCSVIQRYADQNGITLKIIEPVVLNGQRISSSDVRQAVVHNNMNRAAKLLGRPYQLDVSMMQWKKENRVDGNCFVQAQTVCIIAENLSEQIIPPLGKYDVYVIDTGERRFSAVLYTDFDFLRLEIPSEMLVQSIRIIEFI